MQDPARSRADSISTKGAMAALAIACVIGVLSGCGGSSNSGSSASAPKTSTTTISGVANPPFMWAKTVMSHQGYSPVNADQYSTASDLRYMVGRQSPTKMKVFFFLGDDRWLGTDTADPSMTIDVAHSDGNSVQVTYSLYTPNDGDNKPTGGTKTVTFKWDGSKLTPLDEIPTSKDSAPLSRR